MYHSSGEEVLHANDNVIKTNDYSEENITKILKQNDIDGIILRAPARINSKIIDACGHSVKAISGAGVGLDNIDVEYASKMGIRVLHAPKINSNATAEHTVSFILALYKHLLPFHTETRKGNFSIRNERFTYELKGKQLGLVGFGSIAQRVAKILRNGFEMEVKVFVREIKEKHKEAADKLGVRLTTSMEEVFKFSDVVCTHIPLTNETEKIINEYYFQMMKPTSVFINTARGGVINEKDLAYALEKKWLMGAGIDVFSNEPPEADHPLYKLDNVLLTPHIGGISEEAARETSCIITKNLLKVIRGEQVATVANLKMLKEEGFKSGP
ncbi:hydroxyacid dehydrogenase [Halalkalibacillus sediminis]|uniref:Hydroxyacid dehydrogenase n=2 Tax=Halalkalibacillus sediminis TaxID=2018042 RepID=A0A2I0QV50_9BACI|nr:hydroxyacid dehydrogenase [Halalkalibacillus sediminis]